MSYKSPLPSGTCRQELTGVEPVDVKVADFTLKEVILGLLFHFLLAFEVILSAFQDQNLQRPPAYDQISETKRRNEQQRMVRKKSKKEK